MDGIINYSLGFDAKTPFQDPDELKRNEEAAYHKSQAEKAEKNGTTYTYEKEVSTPTLEIARKVASYLTQATGVFRLVESIHIKAGQSTYHPLSLGLLIKFQMDVLDRIDAKFGQGRMGQLDKISKESQTELKENHKLEEKTLQSADMPDIGKMEEFDLNLEESLHLKVIHAGVEASKKVPEKIAQAGLKTAYVATTVFARVAFTALAIAPLAYEIIKSVTLRPSELIKQEATTITKLYHDLKIDKVDNLGENRYKIIAKGVGIIFKETMITLLQPLKMVLAALPVLMLMGDKHNQFTSLDFVKTAIETQPDHRRLNTFSRAQKNSINDLNLVTRPRANAVSSVVTADKVEFEEANVTKPEAPAEPKPVVTPSTSETPVESPLETASVPEAPVELVANSSTEDSFIEVPASKLEAPVMPIPEPPTLPPSGTAGAA